MPNHAWLGDGRRPAPTLTAERLQYGAKRNALNGKLEATPIGEELRGRLVGGELQAWPHVCFASDDVMLTSNNECSPGIAVLGVSLDWLVDDVDGLCGLSSAQWGVSP